MSEGEGTPPVVIVRPETTISGGTAVQEKMIAAARAFAVILKPTFGPRGLDIMLYKTDGTTAVTNDGAKIVAELKVKHPAAKAFVSLAESQENACGDGVTRSLLFCGELLAEADRLIRMGLHPLTIVDGFLAALEIVENEISSFSTSINSEDQKVLESIANTALRGKSADQNIALFSSLASVATIQISRLVDGKTHANSEDISMYLQGTGGLNDSCVIQGIIVRRRVLLDRLEGKHENSRIAVISGDLSPRSLTRDAEIEVQNPDQLSQFIEEQEKLRTSLVEKLVDLEIRAIIAGGEIDPDILHHLADKGIFVAGEFDESELRNLASSTGSTIASSIHHLDNTDIDGTLVVDGTNISLDSTSTLNIDNSNTTNGITIGTATANVPIKIGRGDVTTTIEGNTNIRGNVSSSHIYANSASINEVSISRTLIIGHVPDPTDTFTNNFISMSSGNVSMSGWISSSNTGSFGNGKFSET